MAKVQTKMGGYTIHARKTEEFTFWWGDDYLPASYFDVSIEPNADGLNLSPLIEEGRKITTIAPNGHRQPQLILTLRNNNHLMYLFSPITSSSVSSRRASSALVPPRGYSHYSDRIHDDRRSGQVSSHFGSVTTSLLAPYACSPEMT